MVAGRDMFLNRIIISTVSTLCRPGCYLSLLSRARDKALWRRRVPERDRSQVRSLGYKGEGQIPRSVLSSGLSASVSFLPHNMTPSALLASPTAVHKAYATKPSNFNHPLDPLTPDEVYLPIGRPIPH